MKIVQRAPNENGMRCFFFALVVKTTRANVHKYWALVPLTLNIIKVGSYWKHLTAMTALQVIQTV